MGSFEWDNSYSVGEPHLDEQHKGLIRLINMLEEDAVVPAVLDELQLYIDEHFRDEEAMLEEAGYPDIAAHKLQHQAFEEWLDASRQVSRSGEVAGLLRDNIRSYLKTWLVNHIMVSDKAYTSYLS